MGFWICFFAALACLPLPARAEDWPCWRGPRGDGTSLETGTVTGWDGPSGRNIAWKTELPGAGHASPIVCGDRIFTVSCREDRGERVLVCLDRANGRILWEKTVLTAPLEKKHRLNSHASGTPASDGKLVYAAFAGVDPSVPKSDRSYTNEKEGEPGDPCEMVVTAYDFEGRCRWRERPGRFASRHGFCSSPVLFENLVILNGDYDGDAYLVALDKTSGKTVWKTPRENKTRSYSTPIVRQVGPRTQLMLSGNRCVASYDPRTGKRQWIIDGPTEQFVASLVYNGELLFLTAGFPDFHIMAIRPDGAGNVTKTHVAWHTTQGCAYVPSPTVAGGGKYFLVVSDNGVASCFEARTGQRHWMERIGPHYSASLLEAGGLVHFLSDRGVTTIVRPGPKFEVVAENRLGEDCYASPAVSGGCIYIRAEKHLFCIAPAANRAGSSQAAGE
ncbi:MAG: PQQ-binding-like beta-propeller repeat protein [Thermoguttaceae bacterium]